MKQAAREIGTITTLNGHLNKHMDQKGLEANGPNDMGLGWAPCLAWMSLADWSFSKLYNS